MMVQLLSLGLLAMSASASVTVRKTGRAPTGYEVDFKYVDKTAKSVRLSGGGLGLFNDPFRTSIQRNKFLPPTEYKPGYFMMTAFPGYVPVWPYEMNETDDGVWTLTTPLPSGTIFFNYEVDCYGCFSPKLVYDPDLPPFENVPGDQAVSTFQVPFDPEFQLGEPLVNFDYAMDAPEGKRGTIQAVNYTVPGSIWPAPDVHDFIIYLPPDYGKEPGKKYPLLYMLHGMTANAADFESKMRTSHILDNLIAGGHIEPTVVVFPNYFNLDASQRYVPGDGRIIPIMPPGCDVVRKHFQDVLFPLVEDSFDVCDESWCRAIAGLSLGSSIAYEMWTNATEYFDYFGFFSTVGFLPSPWGNVDDFIRQKPSAASKGIFLGSGLYDELSFNWNQEFARLLDITNTEYVSRTTPFGEHFHPTWQDHFWWFACKTLWKPVPNQKAVSSE